MTTIKTRPLTRQQIGDFIKSDRGVRAFEAVQDDIGSQNEAISTASFLVVGSEPALGSERVLALSPGELTGADGGANANFTLGLADTAVSPGVYEALGASFTFDGKGRLIGAVTTPYTSDAVPEGASNLYFTQIRARSSLSGGSGISYNSVTGQIAVSSKLAAYDGGDTPSAFTLSIVDSANAAAWRAAIGAGTSTVTPSALTKTDDTNVTLTLGGSPATALLANTSLTLGWTGTLSVARGGTGVTTSTGSGDNVLSVNPAIASPAISGNPSLTGAAGSYTDVTASSISLAASATVDFANFSGSILVNDYGSGGVGFFMVGGGAVAVLTASAGIGGAVTYIPGINGYRFTNTSGGTRTFAFAAIRMRPSA